MKMVSVTLSVPQELKKKMEEFHDINWSAVAREAIQRKMILLERFRKFSKESTFTEEEALELGKKVNQSVRKWHGL